MVKVMGTPHHKNSKELPVGLPDWFNESNYVTAKKLDAKGWFYQLYIRRRCFDIVHNDKRTSADEKFLNEWIGKIIRYGILPNRFYPIELDRGILNFHTHDFITKAVIPLTLAHLVILYDKTKPHNAIGQAREIIGKYSRYTKKRREAHRIWEYPVNFYMWENWEKLKLTAEDMFHNIDTDFHLTIDLLASDTDIKKDLQTILTSLRKMRKNLNFAKKRKLIFGKWIKYKILQYLDIRLSEYVRPKDDTQSQTYKPRKYEDFATLYNDVRGNDERVKKTIHKCAFDAISINLFWLNRYIRHEFLVSLHKNKK
jgi:hypothetical protein